MNLDKTDPYLRQMDDFLMRRLDRLELSVDDMRKEFLTISGKLDKISEAQKCNQPSISAMKSVLDAGGMLKWSVSTVVVICASFAAIMTGWEALQKWLGR